MVCYMIPDDVYVHKTVEGDGSAFNELVQRHYTKIYGLACRMLGNPDDASDATQETFLEAYKSLESFQFQSKFSTWLYRVAINTCQQHIRKSDSRGRTLISYSNSLREPGCNAEADIPERLALKTERDNLIQAAINQLPPKQRAVVVLFYAQNLKYREIALVLDCSEGTVASRLNTAIRNLKSMLKDL
ncbi:MAG: sigma-70 family RNA polymerase sigma factor [Candidatus Poribacteria bacterium]|nr:sigma-70 family RNA polymerase sigma factor [Candidatus Poribacteria bacterium]